MHPILFRIPLPKSTPLQLWWALAAVAAIAAIYAIVGLRKKERNVAVIGLVVAIGAAVAARQYRAVSFTADNLPIYSYGVMLGLSLVVGWYLTLTLAERDGLPKETMANCYVITALAAIAGSRILYIVTNLDEFRVDPHDPSTDLVISSFFALKKGGLVAYGGFLGGFLGSWFFLNSHKIRLMPWADVAVPSLASGLLITRIGCYMFGCDFGKRLPATAPGFLQKLGTFPHWADGTLEGGGARAFTQQLEVAGRGTPAAAELLKMNHSFPVHPTQLYESVTGLALLLLLLWQRKHQKFRGQVFFLFAFAYGYLRFLFEIVRDDTDRGNFGNFPEHVFIPGSLVLMALAFTLGISLGITKLQARTVARILSFVPAIVAYFVLRPQSFGATVLVHPSTSQWIGLLSALVVSYFYAQYWQEARRAPKLAMSLESLGDIKPTTDDAGPRRKKRDEEEDEEDDEHAEAEGAEASAKPAKTKVKAKPAPESEDEEDDDEGDEPDGEAPQKAG